MKTFHDWLAIQKGLWLHDDQAVEGLSKLPQPKPKKLPQRKPLTQASEAAGASGAAKVFSRTNEKRAAMMAARIDCLL